MPVDRNIRQPGRMVKSLLALSDFELIGESIQIKLLERGGFNHRSCESALSVLPIFANSTRLLET